MVTRAIRLPQIPVHQRMLPLQLLPLMLTRWLRLQQAFRWLLHQLLQVLRQTLRRTLQVLRRVLRRRGAAGRRRGTARQQRWLNLTGPAGRSRPLRQRRCCTSGLRVWGFRVQNKVWFQNQLYWQCRCGRLMKASDWCYPALRTLHPNSGWLHQGFAKRWWP